MLAYNEFAYRKTNDHCKLEIRFQKKAIFQSHIHEFTGKKTAYNEGRLYSACRLIGSRIIESAAHSNQILMPLLYFNSTQNTSVNCIIPLLLSLLCWPKVILLGGGHCSRKKINFYYTQNMTIKLINWISIKKRIDGEWKRVLQFKSKNSKLSRTMELFDVA